MTAPIEPHVHRRTCRVLFVAGLLFCCIAALPVDGRHHCMFDSIAREAGPLPTAVVRELPRRGRSGVNLVTAAGSEWAPIRIRFFTEDLENPSKHCTAAYQMRPTFTGKTTTCQTEDILTQAKKNIIVRESLPQAIQLHAERLLVQRITDRFVVPRRMPFQCAQFAIPPSHRREGVENADIVLYVAAGPFQNGSKTWAWATQCSRGKNGRPVVGVINFNPSEVVSNEYFVRVAAHEIAHTLGFHLGIMQWLGMVTNVSGVRGKPSVLLVSSPRTLEKARAHYNCSTAPGMELEDEGGELSSGSHWEMRNAKDELMAGVSGGCYYTALTMAAFEDMGFYRANWSMAETMNWGRNSGCRLLTEKCFAKGKTAYPDMFCRKRSRKLLFCTFDRLALGFCPIDTTLTLEPQFQYFKNPRKGGNPQLWSDYCPFVEPYDNTQCSGSDLLPHIGSRVGPTSRCLKGRNLQYNGYRIGDVCAEVECNKDRGTVRVRYHGDDRWYACSEDGYIAPRGNFTKGKIVCPKYSEVCRETGRDRSGVDLSSGKVDIDNMTH